VALHTRGRHTVLTDATHWEQPMATPITLYFDLVSPYAWLALHAVDGIE
jgi:hypothetical protein